MADYEAPRTVSVVTKQGVLQVPANVRPVSLEEFYGPDAEIPKGLDPDTKVYRTKDGPIFAREVERQAWSREHQMTADGMATDLKGVIDERGTYRKTLDGMAKSLSVQTGWHPKETESAIVASFEMQFQKDPYRYLDQRRAHSQTQDHAPELEQ